MEQFAQLSSLLLASDKLSGQEPLKRLGDSWQATVCRLVAKGQILRASHHLGAHPWQSLDDESSADWLWLSLQLAVMRRDCRLQEMLLRQMVESLQPGDWRLCHGLCQLSRHRGDSFRAQALNAWVCKQSDPPHLLIENAYWLIEQKRLEQAQQLATAIPYQESCDVLLLKARLLRANHQLESVEALLLPHLSHYGHRLDFAEALVEVLFELRRGDLCLPVLRCVRSHQPEGSWQVGERYAQAKLLQRQPAEALRTQLIHRLMHRVQGRILDPGTVAVSYDFLGRADWLQYLHPWIIGKPYLYPDFHSNLLMYASSRAMPSYPGLATNIVEYFRLQLQSLVPSFDSDCQDPAVLLPLQGLKIGWICGDIANHPVARFLYSWLAALTPGSTSHRHLLVATHRPDERYASLFKQLPKVEFLDLSRLRSIPDYVQAIRSLRLDVAIDLNVWTGNNIAPVFVARVAPVQLNYLAYHASSGIPQMDGWLVDHELIPQQKNCQEWHVEKLLRLDRPFLAWSPTSALPEGRVEVPQFAGPIDAPIRFGCFNHPRKISEQALQLWGRLLDHCTDSQLVLKAFAAEDQATAMLLRRRLVRADINPERVLWLSYAPTPEQHLLQYAQVDVALDSFPNTGCTTTCEALWMGVPVITLSGQHYVSRMAHAVLAGAGLREWVTVTEDEYLSLAYEQAQVDRLQWLRHNRVTWRHRLQESPLGDAGDLMHHLHRTFESLCGKSAPIQS